MSHISNNSELDEVNVDSQVRPAKKQGVLVAEDKRGATYQTIKRKWSAREDATGTHTTAVMITLQLEQSTTSDRSRTG